MKHAIENNIIGYSDLKGKDVNNARKLWGPSEPTLKGKTPAKKSGMEREDERMDLPEELNDKFQNVTPCFFKASEKNKCPPKKTSVPLKIHSVLTKIQSCK